MTLQVKTFPYASGPLKMALLAYPLLILADEAVAMAVIPAHLVLAHVVVAASGVYGFFWLLRLHRSMVARPHAVSTDDVTLHRGHFGSASVARSEIVSAVPIDVEALARLPERPARFDLGGERVLITLRAPRTYRAKLGRESRSRTIVVSADEPSALCEALTATR
jgi:hypothetical protein